MPIEAELLREAPYPNVACPKCGEYPLVPFMRGLVQRRSWTFNWLKLFPVHMVWAKERYGTWRAGMVSFFNDYHRMPWKKPRHYCSIICSECQEIVGHESPTDEDRERNRKKFYERPARKPPDVMYVDPEGRDQVQEAARSSMSSNISSSVADMSELHPKGCMCWGCRQNRIDSSPRI
jgi:hypothetical protein